MFVSTATITTTPTGDAAGAATNLAAYEQHDSSLHPSVQQDGRTATSSSHTRLGHMNTHVVLLMACELLRYQQADAGYNTWLGHTIKLVTAAGEAPTPSCPLLPPAYHTGTWCTERLCHLACATAQSSPSTTRARTTSPMEHLHMPKTKPAATSSVACRLAHI
ncbi:hypothetical protein D1007_40301 [Hordeum vulgare]|nr:hypothetical protein D1007_40301 [Hordeum vulgare]